MKKTTGVRSFVKAVSLLAVAAVVCLIAFVSWEMYLQTSLGPQVHERYGVRIGSPYVRFGAESQEVMAVEALTPGSPLARAGLRERDIVVEPRTIGQLYRRLSAQRGETVFLTIVDGNDGPLLSARKRRTIHLQAP